MTITAKVLSRPYPSVELSNGLLIPFNAKHESFEHNLKNAMASAKLFNSLNDLQKHKIMECV